VNGLTYHRFRAGSRLPPIVKRVLWSFVLVMVLAITLPSTADDFADAKQAFDAEQFPKAIRLLRPLAEKGDPRAQ